VFADAYGMMARHRAELAPFAVDMARRYREDSRTSAEQPWNRALVVVRLVPNAPVMGSDGTGHRDRAETSGCCSSDLVSPLRLRGMAAMLARIKRQVRERHN
jgi:hypothetical protein